MAVTVKRVQLWRNEVESRPGLLAGALGALASAGADLQVVMAYRYPGNQTMGAIEVYPITGKRLAAAAEAAGLSPAAIAALHVEGDNRPGLGYVITRTIAEAGLNIAFLVTHVIGKRYSSLMGFENDADAVRAAALIKKATAARKRR
jgi:hypothetical protein